MPCPARSGSAAGVRFHGHQAPVRGQRTRPLRGARRRSHRPGRTGRPTGLTPRAARITRTPWSRSVCSNASATRTPTPRRRPRSSPARRPPTCVLCCGSGTRSASRHGTELAGALGGRAETRDLRARRTCNPSPRRHRGHHRSTLARPAKVVDFRQPSAARHRRRHRFLVDRRGAALARQLSATVIELPDVARPPGSAFLDGTGPTASTSGRRRHGRRPAARVRRLPAGQPGALLHAGARIARSCSGSGTSLRPTPPAPRRLLDRPDPHPAASRRADGRRVRDPPQHGDVYSVEEGTAWLQDSAWRYPVTAGSAAR